MRAAPGTFALTVSTTGTGSGTVTSNPAGINCGSDCSESYASGTVVTLTRDAGQRFDIHGLGGDADCSDGSVTMTAARSCIAIFSADSDLPRDTVHPDCQYGRRRRGEGVGINCGTSGVLSEVTMLVR